MHEWIDCDGCAVFQSPSMMKTMGKKVTTNTLLLHAPFLVLHKSSAVSVVFDFNASLNDVFPLSPISLPVDLMGMKKRGLLMDSICVDSFVFTTQIEFYECRV